MKMQMKDSLTGGGTYVDADVIAVGSKLRMQPLPHFKNQFVDGGKFSESSLKKVGDVPFGYDEGMASVNRAAVIKGFSQAVLREDFGCPFLAEDTVFH
jgi:hypothetical protein